MPLALDTNAGLAPAFSRALIGPTLAREGKGEGIMGQLAHQVKTFISYSFPDSGRSHGISDGSILQRASIDRPRERPYSCDLKVFASLTCHARMSTMRALL